MRYQADVTQSAITKQYSQGEQERTVFRSGIDVVNTWKGKTVSYKTKLVIKKQNMINNNASNSSATFSVVRCSEISEEGAMRK